MTGLGTPVANLLVPDLVAYQGPGTTYAGSPVAPLQNAGLVDSGTTDSGPMDVFSVFDSFTVTNVGLSQAQTKGTRLPDTALGLTTNSTSPAAQNFATFDEVLGALLDTDSHDTFIGDLAFEQVSSGTRKARSKTESIWAPEGSPIASSSR